MAEEGYKQQLLANAVTKNKEDALVKAEASYSNTNQDFESFIKDVTIYLHQRANSTNGRAIFIPSPEQLRFLLSDADYLACIAAAGSGKSTVLISKIQVQAKSHGWTGDDILVITYTNKATKDMKDKYLSLCRMFATDSTQKFKTIHKFGKDFLSIVKPGVHILTEDSPVMTPEYDEDEGCDKDVEHTMHDILKQSLRMADVNKDNEPMVVTPKQIYSAMSVISEKQIQSDEEFRETDENFSDFPISYNKILEVRKLYTQIKNSYNCIDYMDMLEVIYLILKNSIPALCKVGNKGLRNYLTYKAIYIDEVQDISPLQIGIVQELLRLNPTCKLIVVGDDDQSIYRFRGSDPSFLLNFADIFKPAEDVLIGYDEDTDEPIYQAPANKLTTEIIYMTVNRRSAKRIIMTANELIKHNKIRYDKVMRHRKKELGEVRLIADTHGMLSKGIILKKLQEVYRNGQGNLKDIGILYREHKQVSPILDMLVKFRIPMNGVYAEYSDLYAFNSKVSKDIIGILSMCEDLQNPLLIKEHLFKICPNITKKGAESIAHVLTQEAKTVKDPKLRAKLSNIMKRSTAWASDIPILLEIVTMIKRKENMGFIIPYVYDKYYEAYFKKLVEETPSYEALIKPSLDYLNSYPEYTWREFSQYQIDTRKWVHENYHVANGVALTSDHASKGLEYDTTFILEISDAYTPKESILEKYSDKGKAEYIEEERRLLYVALTRAKTSATIFYNPENEDNLFVRELKDAIQVVEQKLISAGEVAQIGSAAKVTDVC